MNCAELKEQAQDGSNWRQRKWKPAHIRVEYSREIGRVRSAYFRAAKPPKQTGTIIIIIIIIDTAAAAVLASSCRQQTYSHVSLSCQSTDSVECRQAAHINYNQETLNI